MRSDLPPLERRQVLILAVNTGSDHWCDACAVFRPWAHNAIARREGSCLGVRFAAFVLVRVVVLLVTVVLHICVLELRPSRLVLAPKSRLRLALLRQETRQHCCFVPICCICASPNSSPPRVSEATRSARAHQRPFVFRVNCIN